MATAIQKIILSSARDIPFNKLVLSQSNVRRVKAGVSIEELAESIARRGLIQSLHVRPVLDADGAESGMFEVPAGGRRYRALELLAKQKRLAKTAPVPCVVGDANSDILVDEVSLVENMERAPLHPLDQFRAFQSMRDKGMTEEAIAAAFFVGVNVVKQRLRLASVSQTLLEIYADDGMTLEQLMAFTVSSDPARQEQVWKAVKDSWQKEPYQIRRMLTETSVRASDKRAVFIGIDAYEAAGGVVLRDLFQSDDGGWLQDPALLDRLVAEKLKTTADEIASEGWKWVEAALSFPYGHQHGLREMVGVTVDLTEEERATREALRDEYDRLEAEYAEADELPVEIDARLGEIEQALDAFEQRPTIYDPADIAIAGVFISLDADGSLSVDRGYVRPEDERPVETEGSDAPEVSALSKIANLLPTHTRRSTESQTFQQFSTPIPLGLVAACAAAITPADRVLEPSAGTGLFAIFAEIAGGALVLNELADTRASLLSLLFPAIPVARFDATQIDDHLDPAVTPMRGDWHDLGGGLTEGSADSVSLQPLARVDDAAERAWAADWLGAILARESVAITPEVKEHLWTALTSLASAPIEERTITGLCVLSQSNDLKQALRPYCIGGAWGRLLDAEAEHLGTATVQAFETEGLIGTEAAPAVLAYLFHRIEDRLDGSPTLIIVDEGWLALDDEGFAGQLREWLKTLRKKNASVIFATQSLTRAELMTNLVINTDRRTYHMELRSTPSTYMASVSWQYPQDQLIALRRQNSQAEAQQPVANGIDLSRVNFRYDVSGDRAPWRPLRAFDDGRQVFIEFPRGIGQGEMPPLFVVGPEGATSELVNYRVRGNYMIVDRLFAAAELRFGADKNQKRVRISRTDGRPAS